MKLISAVIRPFKLEEVKEALSRLGVTGMTVIEVKSFGRHKNHTETYRGAEYTVDYKPKVKIEFVVTEAMKDKVVAAIIFAARTGKSGDGRVFVSPVEEMYHIRSGESGDTAL
ncbi:MAG: P-II family nitrogen regulator [Opitutae bacterium]|nr:P-II family nitrogen regulator [Opitutae bacterium]